MLFKGVIIPTLLNIPLASLLNFDFYFLLPHTENCDSIIVLPLLVFETL